MHYFLHDMTTGKLRPTSAGINAWGPIFARAGIDIHGIRTARQLRNAIDNSRPQLVEKLLDIVDRVGKSNPHLSEEVEAFKRIFGAE